MDMDMDREQLALAHSYSLTKLKTMDAAPPPAAAPTACWCEGGIATEGRACCYGTMSDEAKKCEAVDYVVMGPAEVAHASPTEAEAGGAKKVVVEEHRHKGVYISRGKEDALLTKNMVPGESVYGEKRISVEVSLPVFALLPVSLF